MSELHNTVVGALKDCINAHGPINKEWIGSAAKRIVNAIEKNVWQPINTAPRDGSIILVYGSFEGMSKTIGKAFWIYSNWELLGDCAGSTFNATHWQPLPKPPEDI